MSKVVDAGLLDCLIEIDGTYIGGYSGHLEEITTDDGIESVYLLECVTIHKEHIRKGFGSEFIKSLFATYGVSKVVGVSSYEHKPFYHANGAEFHPSCAVCTTKCMYDVTNPHRAEELICCDTYSENNYVITESKLLTKHALRRAKLKIATRLSE